MSLSISEGIFGPFARFAPRATWSRFLLLAVDVAVFNLVFYELLRSVLLQPLGYTTALGVVVWLGMFVAVLLVLHGLKPRQGRPKLSGFVVELLIFGGLLVLAAFEAGFKTTDKGIDYSWLRVEVIKAPLWFAMFTRACPGFTAVTVGVIALLAWTSLSSPRSVLIRILPGVAVAVFIWLISTTFSPLTDGAGFYVIFFSAPLVAFWVSLAFRASVLAFRMCPFVLHTLLIALTYIGVLPVIGLAPEFVCESPSCGPSQPNRFGVARLFPQGDAKPDSSFAFLRKMVLAGDRAFFSYGPTCGIYAVQRDTGALQNLPIPGLIRDLRLSADGRNLWATNWMRGDFLAIDPQSLKPICAADLFRQGMATPWGFVVDRESGLVYMSNVTLPIVAELTVEMQGENCGVKVDRSIDFHATGYTRFTDGAFDLHVDRARNRLYVLVGMLEGRFEIGLVEIELSSFTVLRDIRLPAGTTLVPVRGRDTVLLPSYYGDSIYEVSLPSMTLVRTISAAPTITAIEQDERRNVFYATSRTTGELLVIDDARGAIVRSFAVGAKPDALKLDTATDQLFLGSGRGVFRIDLARFWSPG
jgi:hypothetical protein